VKHDVRMSESLQPEDPKPPVKSYAVLPHAQEPSLLLLPGSGGWSLPFCESEKPLEGRIKPLVQAVHDRLAVASVVLRHVESPEDAAVYLLEPSRPGWTPPEGRWVGQEELSSLTLAVPEHRPVLDRWLAEAADGAPPAERNAWERPGWFAEASRWIEQQLSRLRLTATGPVEQFRTVSISCLLRVPANDEALYLKTALPIFSHEAALAAALSRLFAGNVPDVLAIDPTRRWFLMRGFNGPTLRSMKAIEPWEKTVRLLARMQIDGSHRIDGLLSLGCHDRRLNRLAAQIDPLFADTAALALDGKGLTPEEISRLRALALHLRQLCAELAAGPVPESLVHGDLHGGNIVIADDQVLIYDWTDGCIAHPFLDLITLIEPGCLAEIPDAYPYLRGAYLEAWTAFAPMDELIPLFEQAQLLGALHQAISYQGITTSVEAKEEWASGVPGYLRTLLCRAEADPAIARSKEE
jgi:aminoglycoside phosphotransferase (APT) family kinase protein